MAIASRGWSCTRTCEPHRPCYAQGCLNALPNYYRGPSPYYNASFIGPNPNFQGPHNYFRPNYYGRWNSGPNYYHRPGPPRPNPPRSPNPSHNTVRIGVGNRSETDINIDVYDNLVTGGRGRVHLGSGNYAARSNMGVIANNKADANDLMLAVDNYSGGDNNIRATDNDYTGFDRVHVGSGNYARGSNRIVVGSLSGSGNDGGGSRMNNNQNGRTRWSSSWLGW